MNIVVVVTLDSTGLSTLWVVYEILLKLTGSDPGYSDTGYPVQPSATLYHWAVWKSYLSEISFSKRGLLTDLQEGSIEPSPVKDYGQLSFIPSVAVVDFMV